MAGPTGINASVVAPTANPRQGVKVSVNCLDPEGEVAVSEFWLTSTTTTIANQKYGDINSAVLHFVGLFADLGAFQVQNWSWAVVNDVDYGKPPEPAEALGNIEDKMFVVNRSTAGGHTQMSVPMPELANFLSDGETVDPSSAAVLAWETAAVDGWADGQSAPVTWAVETATGETLQCYVKGYLRRSRTRRRLRQGISTEIGG